MLAMNRPLGIVIALSLCACAVEPERADVASANICTVQDCPDGPPLCTIQQQVSGDCQGPFTSTIAATDAYTNAQYPGAPRINWSCAWGQGGSRWCGLDVTLGFFMVSVFCVFDGWGTQCSTQTYPT